MSTKAQVGAMSTEDHKDPKPAKPAAVSQPKPAPKPAPDGNTPVDPQETQAERDSRRPIDQP